MVCITSKSESVKGVAYVKRLQNNEIVSRTKAEIFFYYFNGWEELTLINLNMIMNFRYGDISVAVVLSKCDLSSSNIRVMSSTTIFSNTLISQNSEGTTSYSTSVKFLAPPLEDSVYISYKLEIIVCTPRYQRVATSMLYDTSHIIVRKE